MTYAIGIGAMLFLGAGLWYINNQDEPVTDEPDEPVVPGDSTDRLQKAMKTGELNNPRNDIHLDSLTDKIPKNYASVDPKRHKMPSKNPKDFDGDSVWVTALGEAVEYSNLKKENQVIGNLKENLKPERLDQLKGVPPGKHNTPGEFF